MSNLLTKILRIITEESGQDLIEYALLGALIAVACTAAMGTVATGINTELGKITGFLT